MNVLAIETSGAVGSVAACRDAEVLAEQCLEKGLAHGRLLVPVIDSVVRGAGWDKKRDIELVAISQGPGSFTGLRVGIAAAKSIAALLGCPIIGVCSLDALAGNAAHPETRVLTALDAKRGQVYAAAYERTPEGPRRVLEPCVCAPAEVLSLFPSPFLLLGDALKHHAAAFGGDGIRHAAEEESRIRASIVARLGLSAFAAGRRDNPYGLEPIYLRLAEAEEKRLARERMSS